MYELCACVALFAWKPKFCECYPQGELYNYAFTSVLCSHPNEVLALMLLIADMAEICLKTLSAVTYTISDFTLLAMLLTHSYTVACLPNYGIPCRWVRDEISRFSADDGVVREDGVPPV